MPPPLMNWTSFGMRQKNFDSNNAIRLWINTKGGNSMNKSELINAVAEKENMTKKDAEKAVNSVLSVVTDALVAGESVQVVGFGTFEVRSRAEKQGRNPKTGEPITVPAAKVPAFKAGKALKDAVAK